MLVQSGQAIGRRHFFHTPKIGEFPALPLRALLQHRIHVKSATVGVSKVVIMTLPSNPAHCAKSIRCCATVCLSFERQFRLSGRLCQPTGRYDNRQIHRHKNSHASSKRFDACLHIRVSTLTGSIPIHSYGPIPEGIRQHCD